MPIIYKCWFDASFCYNSNLARCAFIIKNERGNIICKRTSELFCQNSHEAEAEALRLLIGHIKAYYPSFATYKIHGDNRPLIDLVQNPSNAKMKTQTKFATIISAFQNLLETHQKVELHWIRRVENSPADKASREHAYHKETGTVQISGTNIKEKIQIYIRTVKRRKWLW